MGSDFEDREKLDSEWVTLVALRELLGLALQSGASQSTYQQALTLGATLVPKILGADSLLRQNLESATAREYRQKAEAKSRLSANEFTPVSLLEADIAEFKELVRTSRNQQQTDQLKTRLTHLERALIEVDPKRHSEQQLIIRDVYNVERDIPSLGTGQGYRDFQLPDDNILRLRLFHPDNPEQISGADVIYERHVPKSRRVSVVGVQYKIWEDKSLYLSDERMQRQLARMKSFFCDAELCEAGDYDHCY
jgi:hypothetical protein